jgi:hypothetical protein
MPEKPSQADSPTQLNAAPTEKVETVYDPTEVQLRALGEIASKKLNPTDLATPELVQQILERQFLILAELKLRKDELVKARSENDYLRVERENLRIALAKSEQRESVLWLEIPIGIMSGFAINLLTNDPKNATGWVLLILCTIMLLYLRMPQIKAVRGGGEGDGKS